jgi:hypothetical protein
MEANIFPSTSSAIGLMVVNFAMECAICTKQLSFVMNKNAWNPLTCNTFPRNFLIFSLSLALVGCHFNSDEILFLLVRRAPPRASMSANPKYAVLPVDGVVVARCCPHGGRTCCRLLCSCATWYGDRCACALAAPVLCRTSGLKASLL